MEKFNEAVVKSLEEFNIAESFKSWKEMFEWFKDSKVWYRVPFGDNTLTGFKFKSDNYKMICIPYKLVSFPSVEKLVDSLHSKCSSEMSTGSSPV